ncbi:MAG: FAD:protein FMN transferase [Actinomycetota bacterium]
MASDVVAVFDGPEGLSGHAEARLNELEQAWSRFIEDSDVSRLNRSGTWQRVSPDTIMLFERAITAWELTTGAFDPTVLSSLVASGYGESRSEHPGRTVLSSPPYRGPAPGMSQIQIDAVHGRIRVPEGLGFDPGGIGKGLAADIVAESLIASGAHAVMVSVGGDVRVAGDPPGNWTVEVESPFDQNETIATLRLLNGAVCTSSVRTKTWVHDAESAHHIINPATGYPTSSSIVSATIVAADAWTAEALCKAAIVTEPLDAIAFCRSLGVDAIIVDIEGVMWTTDTVARFAA